jgi:hypothetical protein
LRKKNLTFDQELKIWDATTEAGFDGWQLRYVEKLPVDRDERAVLVTALRGKDLRRVYVNRELGHMLHARFVKSLEDEFVDNLNRESRRPGSER